MENTENLTEEFVAHLAGDVKIDTSETFDAVMTTRDRIWEKIQNSLSLKEDLRCADLHNFDNLNGEHIGRMRTFTGDQSPVDWIIHSNIGTPKNTFTNIHLTIYLDESVDVPHLGMAFGTLPDAFFYIDPMPRYEPLSYPEHLQKYLTPLNDIYMSLQAELFEAGVKPFNAAMPFIRGSLSPVALAGIVPLDFYREKVEPKVFAYVDHWLKLVHEAKAVQDAEARAQLKQRDELIRRNIVHLDPANPIAERLVGKPLADRLVRILCAEERSE
uniref:red chlorophyll catabolite reductase n=1 Tax=Microbulbifer agarilyticus TaxID=260552 RepID=UPI000255B4CC|nr:red chlorophyll catabolite reductase [Microbulbifer agarilyticus]